MKLFITIITLLFALIELNAQFVGINNTDPQVSMDINGAIAHRSVVLNSYFNNINIPPDASFVTITLGDETGPISLLEPDYIDGKRLVIQNLSAYKATLNYGGEEFVIRPNQTKEFICANPGGYLPLQSKESQLEKITEGSNTGWRLLGKNPSYYGNIGHRAIDLSYSYLNSSTLGATAEGATAIGYSTTASNITSLATGFGTHASGYTSTTMGLNTNARGYLSIATGNTTVASGSMATSLGKFTTARAYSSLVIGRYNDSIVTSDQLDWVDTDPLLYLGNGTDENNRKNALVVYKNGNIDINGFTRLGNISEAAPNIKIKKITGIGPATDGNMPIPHGLLASKILSIQIFMQYGNNANPDKTRPPNYTLLAGFEYQYEIDGSNIIITNKVGNSANISAKTFRMLITYEE